jgi:hypothetical protein
MSHRTHPNSTRMPDAVTTLVRHAQELANETGQPRFVVRTIEYGWTITWAPVAGWESVRVDPIKPGVKAK